MLDGNPLIPCNVLSLVPVLEPTSLPPSLPPSLSPSISLSLHLSLPPSLPPSLSLHLSPSISLSLPPSFSPPQLLLDELHSSGKLTSISLWKELYSIISNDPRYHSLLGQPGTGSLQVLCRRTQGETLRREEDHQRNTKGSYLSLSFYHVGRYSYCFFWENSFAIAVGAFMQFSEIAIAILTV